MVLDRLLEVFQNLVTSIMSKVRFHPYYLGQVVKSVQSSAGGSTYISIDIQPVTLKSFPIPGSVPVPNFNPDPTLAPLLGVQMLSLPGYTAVPPASGSLVLYAYANGDPNLPDAFPWLGATTAVSVGIQGNSGVSINTNTGTPNPAARKTDGVKVNVTAADIAALGLVAGPNPVTAGPSPVPGTLSGQITGGSATVNIGG